MKHLDLFSGIGGFALAASWAGFETIQFVEIDPFCQKVLNKNFPGVPIHADVTTFDARPFRGTVDLFTAGFPCQPHSVAGKKKGRDDDRNLWPTIIRLVRDCQPVACLFENVPGLANTMLDEVLGDLDRAGYETEVYCVAAEDVGASHKRERLWIVAYAGLLPGRPEFAEQLPDGSAGIGESITAMADTGCYASSGRGDTENVAGSPRSPQANEKEWEWLRNADCNGRANVADTDCQPDKRRRKLPIADGSIWRTWTEPEGCRRELAYPNSSGRREPCRREPGGEFLASSECGREAVADAKCFSKQQSADEVQTERVARNTRPVIGQHSERVSCHRGLPMFPPARTDYRSWAAVASVDAALMPCVERPVRRVAARLPRRLDGLTGSIRNHRLKALGNAIVPQVAHLFIKGIAELIEANQ